VLLEAISLGGRATPRGGVRTGTYHLGLALAPRSTTATMTRSLPRPRSSTAWPSTRARCREAIERQRKSLEKV